MKKYQKIVLHCMVGVLETFQKMSELLENLLGCVCLPIFFIWKSLIKALQKCKKLNNNGWQDGENVGAAGKSACLCLSSYIFSYFFIWKSLIKALQKCKNLNNNGRRDGENVGAAGKSAWLCLSSCHFFQTLPFTFKQLWYFTASLSFWIVIVYYLIFCKTENFSW